MSLTEELPGTGGLVHHVFELLQCALYGAPLENHSEGMTFPQLSETNCYEHAMARAHHLCFVNSTGYQ